ncbi:DUF2269 family protein [Sporosarcina thermotolerans]|uniref:DUF2269 family protein n=1 Tax=Sporosarcina thermotolerans TaxID=633404 RepID=UPI0024BCA3A3|nr:DUF2269 family protein [Sporosarcina thermotolerans]WHT47815.1 DUF2269 family protein [Sporosarcina thermotolerans]
MYGTIVFVHVFSAVLSIGPLFLLMPSIKRLRNVDESSESAFLSVIHVIIRIVMHAGHVLVISGVLLILTGPWPWYTSWVIATLAIMLLSAFFFRLALRKCLKGIIFLKVIKEKS